MNKHKLGFTLIEILAVVLIVAILTAIALPQYRKSVRRAEAMEALVNIRTIFDSAKRYKAANSEIPRKLRGLDVEFFDASSFDTDSFVIGKFEYSLGDEGVSACRIHEASYCLSFHYTYNNDRDVLICDVSNDSPLGEFMCNSLSTRKDGPHYIIE